MKALHSVGRFVFIHFMMLLIPIIADIVFLGFMSFTVVCFGVAGVFSAVFCFTTLPEDMTSDGNRAAALYTLIALLLVCAILFFLIAPLSGSEYSLPVKAFAVMEVVAAFFWKHVFFTAKKKS